MTNETKREYGKFWRILAHRDGGIFEVESRGTFDELVVDD